MVRLLRWIGLLVTVFRSALIGAAGSSGGGGGGVTDYGIEAQPDPIGNDLTNSVQYGWEFTVGASDIEVASLRAYSSLFNDTIVRLWRMSDSSLLASKTIPGAGDAWSEETLGSTVTLSSGSSYMLSVRDASGGNHRIMYDTIGNFTINSAITFEEVWYVNGDGFPNTSAGSAFLYGLSDMGFSVA